MKKVLLLVVLILLVSATAVYAAVPREGFGVGALIGAPFQIGTAAEYNFGTASVNAVIGYDGGFMFRIGGDYNFQEPFVNEAMGIDLYLSVGGYLNTSVLFFSSISIGVPVTLAYYFNDLPIKLYVKSGPEITFGGWKGTGLGAFATIGGLYLF